jgi:2'-hydroxyisoflavone reductase
MKLLILGGTRFLGRHLVDAALARGHEVTLFNRGKSQPGPVAGVETLHGDRSADLRLLEGRNWDAVIDTSGYWPSQVRKAAQLLSGRVGHYTFVSSISVYRDFSRRNIGESSPVLTLEPEVLHALDRPDPDSDSLWANYGPLKYHCEREAEAAMPGRTLIIRPGLLAGPYDGSDRFSYWVGRLSKGGEVLAPGRPERLIQLIDARDLASWMLKMAESSRTGTYNAVGPGRALTMAELLETCRAVSGADAKLTWVSDSFLEEQHVAPWAELPLWIPETSSKEGPDMSGFLSIDSSRAIEAGLTFRPLADTVRDTLRWLKADQPGKQASLAEERERSLLELWHNR